MPWWWVIAYLHVSRVLVKLRLENSSQEKTHTSCGYGGDRWSDRWCLLWLLALDPMLWKKKLCTETQLFKTLHNSWNKLFYFMLILYTSLIMIIMVLLLLLPLFLPDTLLKDLASWFVYLSSDLYISVDGWQIWKEGRKIDKIYNTYA